MRTDAVCAVPLPLTVTLLQSRSRTRRGDGVWGLAPFQPARPAPPLPPISPRQACGGQQRVLVRTASRCVCVPLNSTSSSSSRSPLPFSVHTASHTRTYGVGRGGRHSDSRRTAREPKTVASTHRVLRRAPAQWAGHAITARHAATAMRFDFGSEPSRGRALTPALAPLSEGRLRHTHVFRHVLVQLLLVKLACPQLTVVVREDGGVARLLAAAHAKPNRAPWSVAGHAGHAKR